MNITEWNEVTELRMEAKRACEAAVGTPEYPALLKAFRVLDHRREELMQARRQQQ